MQFENYRAESIIWADPNGIWSAETATLNNWKETATSQNIPHAPRSTSLCPPPSNGRCRVQVSTTNTQQQLSSSVRSAYPVPFLLMARRTCAASFLSSQPPLIHWGMSPTHVPDVVRASILTDYSISGLIGQEKTGYRKGGMMQKALR